MTSDLATIGTDVSARPRAATPRTAGVQGRRTQMATVAQWLIRPLLGAGVLFGLWALFAPTALGGSDTYVATDGISMLPRFHANDLVLLRSESSYHVGEVAGYHNAQLHEVVMHRIIGRNGDRYIFKGDNNNFTDTYQPTKSQIVGAEWLHLPGWGRWLNDLRAPFVTAALLAALWLLSFRSKPATRRRQRRRHAH